MELIIAIIALVLGLTEFIVSIGLDLRIKKLETLVALCNRNAARKGKRS
jgi:hypothetical protein